MLGLEYFTAGIIDRHLEKEEFMELLPDGSKRPLEEPQLPESNAGT